VPPHAARHHQHRLRRDRREEPVNCDQIHKDLGIHAADPDPKRLPGVVRSLGSARCAAVAQCIDQNEAIFCRPKDAP
jgi:hypothetical protein